MTWCNALQLVQAEMPNMYFEGKVNIDIMFTFLFKS